MKNKIYPCIWSDGQAREAALFYCSLFEKSKIIDDNPMVVNFELSGQQFMLLNGGPMFRPNPSISLSVICETDEEINKLWRQLTENGKIMMPLDQYDWSEKYGFLEDRFGVAWQLMKGDFKDVKQKITPCLLFVGDNYGQAEKAVRYYTGLFPEAAIQGILLYEANEPMDGKVKHSQFTLNGTVFMAMDGMGEHHFDFNEGLSLVVTCKDQQEIDYYWEQLTANGGVESQCGWLKDPFGVSWQIVPEVLGQLMQDPDKGPRVIQAFMKMKKFDIAALMNA